MTYLPANLKILREEKKLSQQQIADYIGIKQRAYSDYENGKSEPTATTLAIISDLFKIPLDFLVKFSLLTATKEDRAFFYELANRTGLRYETIRDNHETKGA